MENEKLKALKNLGYTGAEAKKILKTLSNIPENNFNEGLFWTIISWANDCTGNNASFSPEYGEASMNELHSILGLESLSKEELKERYT